MDGDDFAMVCNLCLRPVASEEQWVNDHNDGNGCECPECVSVCWGDFPYCMKVVRAREKRDAAVSLRLLAAAWKACAKKWRSIVKQVDAECDAAFDAELAALGASRFYRDALLRLRERIMIDCVDTDEIQEDITRILDEAQKPMVKCKAHSSGMEFVRGGCHGCNCGEKF